MKKYILLLCVSFFLTSFRQGPANINDVVKDFSLLNAVDNNPVSLSDYSGSKVVVIVFTSPGCAFGKIYDERLVQLAGDFKDQEVSFLLINPNNSKVNPEDSPANMAKRAQEKGYIFPYLVDNSQKIANMLGASKTPEAFVLKNVNGSFVLKYRGAIDDNPQLASAVKEQYLKEAILAVIHNNSVKMAERKATGCSIRK